MGRRPTLLLGLGLNSAAGLLSALVPGFYSLCFLRFLAGLGVGAILSSLVTLATESSPPSKRGRNVAFVGCFFTFGTVYVALLALWFYGGNPTEKVISWRIFVALCALPSFLGTVMVYIYVPESARFLALQHRHAEATKIANHIGYAMGFRGQELEESEIQYHHSSYRPYHTTRNPAISFTVLKQITSIAMASISKLYTPEILPKTLTLQVVWMTLSFGAGLSTWINVVLKKMQVSNLYYNALYYSLASIPGNLAAAYFMDRMGRKTLMAFGMLGASMSLLYFSKVASDFMNTEIPNNDTNASIATLCACIFHAFVVIAWGTVNVITSESFPTEVRSTGLGVCAASARMIAMFVQYVNGALVDQPDVLLRISSIAMLIGALFSMTLRDTSFKPLKDEISFMNGNGKDYRNLDHREDDYDELIKNGNIEMKDDTNVDFV